MKVDIKIEQKLNHNFNELVTLEFIRNREREGTILDYFPFLKDNEFYNITLSYFGNIVGGAVVQLKYNKFGQIYGKIGLVVIEQRYRGLGLFNILMNSLIDFAKNKKIYCLYLWAKNKKIYQKHGFNTDEPILYMTVPIQSTLSQFNKTIIHKFEAIPTYVKEYGFVEVKDTKLYYLYDGKSPIYFKYENYDFENINSIISTSVFGNKNSRLYLNKNDKYILKLHESKKSIFSVEDVEMQMTLILNEQYLGEFIHFNERI